MNGLEHRREGPLGIEIRGRRYAERAGQRGRQIGQDIGVKVGRHDRVDRFRPHDHAHRHGIDQHLVPGDVLELGRDLRRDLVPHHHGVALRVRLGDDGQELPRPRPGQAEGEAHDPFDAGAREHGDVGRCFERRALVHPAPDAGIFALGILAHDHPVELAAIHVAQRRGDPRQHAGRAHVGVLIEGLADGEPKAPERDVVGNLRMPGRAEQDRVVLADQVPPVGRHHAAVLLVILAAPVEVVDLEREAAVAPGDGVQRFETGRNHFRADAVTRDRRDRVCFHVGLPVLWKYGGEVSGFAAPSEASVAFSKGLKRGRPRHQLGYDGSRRARKTPAHVPTANQGFAGTSSRNVSSRAMRPSRTRTTSTPLTGSWPGRP